MAWLVMAVALAGTLPMTGAGQEEGGAKGDRDAPRHWAASVRCEEVLARDGREGWMRLCLPGDPLRLGASFAWGRERQGEARDGQDRPNGPDGRGDDRPTLEGRDGPDGPAGGDLGDRPGDGGRGDAGGPGCAAGSAGCAATVTPEPVTLVLLGSGLAGIAGASYRRRRRGPPAEE